LVGSPKRLFNIDFSPKPVGILSAKIIFDHTVTDDDVS
jgi:hypothetical protein